ncbi:AMP-dependent synthetase/ligase domain-containing protein [Strongyloides ratti]|uniref:long-chain-fatty-acid--CoA ligase n=1 Tax=Strongyloides ratti TaxID=34506 RepID=A0A090KQS7_STRRB|nr:AMP-dependent synthetase/ligase domain-containing protein [Strongyloides ratti]CEF59893.2 AMP-dependent synthetase/ligase domain-containing protein [Strongyloides ratti]
MGTLSHLDNVYIIITNKFKMVGRIENSKDDSNSLSSTALRSISNSLFKFGDIFTNPIHRFFDNPKKRLEKSNSIKGVKLNNEDCHSFFRNVKSINKLSSLLFPNSLTLDKVWDRCVQLYSNNPCMGTREIIKIFDEKQPDGKIFHKCKFGQYKWLTYKEVNDQISNLSRAICHLNLPKGSFIVIFAETRAEWQITAQACIKSGFPIVTVYATLGKEAVKSAIKECGAVVLFTTSSHFEIINDISDSIESVKYMIYFEDRYFPTSKDLNKQCLLDKLKNKFTICEFFDSFIYSQKDSTQPIISNCKEDDVCLIMYTSGSVGIPKGVMLTHKNVIAAVVGLSNVIKASDKDIYAAYLPLAHILEICAEYIAFSYGAKIGYSTSQTLFDTAIRIHPGTKGDTAILKPTIIAAVPAIMDRIYKAVLNKISNSNKISKELFNICYERRLKRLEKGYKSILIDKFVFRKIKMLLGGNVRLLISGGAPLNPASQRFMNICFGCPVTQGYGLTETCGAATITEPSDISTGYVGAPLICNEVYLKECPEIGYKPSNTPPQGEILIHGDNVCKGYFNNPEKNKEDFVIIDGKRYFCTGDIGEVRNDGSIKIIDRKKDLVKTSRGEYVSLGKVESNLITNYLVDNICVVVNPQKSHTVALIVPNQNNLTKFAEKMGIVDKSWEDICNDSRIKDSFVSEIKKFSKPNLERFEIPTKVFLCHEPWTPVNGMLTEALKLKRNIIQEKYRKEINEMYQLK